MTDSEIKKLLREAENWATFRFVALMTFIVFVCMLAFNIISKLYQIIKLLGGVR